MAEQVSRKLPDEYKKEYIKANYQLIPAVSREKFQTWDLDKQYTQMRNYVRKADKTPGIVKETMKTFKSMSPRYSDIAELLIAVEKYQEERKEERIKELEEKTNKQLEELKQLKKK